MSKKTKLPTKQELAIIEVKKYTNLDIRFRNSSFTKEHLMCERGKYCEFNVDSTFVEVYVYPENNYSTQIISAVCLTCGVRDNHTTTTGYCQNDHDNWLEERDVLQENQWFHLALKTFNLSAARFKKDFMNNGIKQFVIKKEKIKS